MTSSGVNTLKAGNIARTGRQEVNKIKKALDLIGEDNLRTLVSMHLNTAFNHEDVKVRTSCQEFLMDRFLPKPAPIPHQTYINIELLPNNSLENIKENEDKILTQVSTGKLSLQEGEKLLSMTQQARTTYEATEAMKLIQSIDTRLKENGM